MSASIMSNTAATASPHHRVHPEDVPALEDGRPLTVRTLEPPVSKWKNGIGVGTVVCYEPVPPRLATARTDHPTADLQPCRRAEVGIIPEIPLLADPADRWLVIRATRYELALQPFGKAPPAKRRGAL